MPKREVWHPALYEIEDIRAIQAIADYAALAGGPPDETGRTIDPPSPLDCKRALDWIINKAAQKEDNGFTPNDSGGLIGAFIDGRQSVGQQIIKLIKLKPGIFEEGN